MPPRPTFLDELRLAAYGTIALLRGDRASPSYFDLGMRGLIGSFIAFLVASAVNIYVPALLGIRPATGSLARDLIVLALLYALQIGFGALVLRQINRLDALVPYLVADNWVTFFVTLLSTVLTLFGLSIDVSVILIGILVIVLEVNIARLVVTLSPLQIAMFLIAQIVGVIVGLFAITLIMPLAPELAADLAGSVPQ